jgi:hypothetical protein
MATAAADQEQSGLIQEMMESELYLNPWMRDRVKIGRIRAYGPGGKLKILNSNTSSTWGLNSDVVILDELTWWEDRGLWDVLISGARKRNGVLVVISNAGVRQSWQWDIHEEVKRQPEHWQVYDAPQYTRLATWMSETGIAADRKTMPVALAKRVFDNIWIDPGEESGYLVEADVIACELLGKSLGLQPTLRGTYGIDYFVGVDYGPKRDRTVLVVLHQGEDLVVRVDEFQVWQGTPEAPVQIAAIESWLDDVNKRFNNPTLVLDPYQMESTAQRYEKQQTVIRFEPRGGKSNYQMAAHLRSLVANRRLAWYHGAGDLPLANGAIETFSDELRALVFKTTPYGYRFDHETKLGVDGRTFHDDRAVGVGMPALQCSLRPPSPAFQQPTPVPGMSGPVLPQDQPTLRPFLRTRGFMGMEDREERRLEGRTWGPF